MASFGKWPYPLGRQPLTMESEDLYLSAWRDPVFAHHCSHCQQRQLIFPNRITGIHNTDRGIVVDFLCWCGAPQAFVTGRATERGATTHAPASAA
jgi:hypothetical protein